MAETDVNEDLLDYEEEEAAEVQTNIFIYFYLKIVRYISRERFLDRLPSHQFCTFI